MAHGIFTVLLLISLSAPSSAPSSYPDSQKREFRQAVSLYEKGFYAQARNTFDGLESNEMTAGYSLLCSEALKTKGYEKLYERYVERYPYSRLTPQIKFQRASNLFDDGDYLGASDILSSLKEKSLPKSDRPKYLFEYAYSFYKIGRKDLSSEYFLRLDALSNPDYSAPSRYALGYMAYERKDYKNAATWFSKASKDGRFKTMSEYYILDCNFLLKEYEYVTAKGPELMEQVPSDLRSHVARIVSESYLLIGKTEQARKYYQGAERPKTRDDFFYAGSLFYAAKDYEKAVENYEAIKDRKDSLGQAASYNLGASYLQLKNKVAAMRCFREASSLSYEPEVTEDALFNYAKLSFDLNNDPSAFYTYIRKYPSKAGNDKIYGYMAVAALRSKDYQAAVEAFDKIDVLDPNMRSNYMKTNYLRANELIGQGAYSQAIPLLKAAGYYARRGDSFRQLCQYWQAESEFRCSNWSQARSLFTDLYNNSALEGVPEAGVIPFGVAYCYFNEGNYEQALRWFDKSLLEGSAACRETSFLRKGDCLFLKKKYSEAIPVYQRASSEYSTKTLYADYQAGICYGLLGKNKEKVQALSRVRSLEPGIRFYDESYFELGRAYVSIGDNASALDCFNTLISTSKDSNFVARGLVELGSIARNEKRTDDAIAYYKRVAGSMTTTPSTGDALAALESIYQSLGQPRVYLDYLSSIGKGSLKTDEQKSQMIFSAAEQTYLSEDYEKAVSALKDYLAAYPTGELSSKANFYLADCYRRTDQKEAACDLYARVVAEGAGEYQEVALSQYAPLALSLQRCSQAYEAYTSLLNIARFDQNRSAAQQGLMESAFKGRMFDKAIPAAKTVCETFSGEPSIKRHAQWVLAKSYLASSQREEAFALLKTLSKQPKTSEGAEAMYLLIQDCFDRGDFNKVEHLVYSFADSGSQEEYWVAKSFIVLGDAFLEMGDEAQARATFQSVADEYVSKGPDDDVPDNVKLRLSALN